MKKISIFLLMFVLVMSFMMPNVFAFDDTDITKTLIVRQGTNLSNKLEYPGYKIIENNVDSNVIGEYQVVYESLETNTQLVKKVVVESEDQTFFVEQKTIDSKLNHLYQFELISSTNVTEDDYIVTTKATHKSTNAQSLYLFYVKDDKLDTSYFALYLQKQSIVDVIYNPLKDEMISIVTGPNNFDGNLDFELYIRKLNNQIMGTYKYNDPRNDIAESAILVKNNLVISGYSIDDKTKEKDSFIAVYDAYTYDLKNFFIYSKEGDDEFIDLYTKDNYLYALRKTNENYAICKIDIFGNLHQETQMNFLYDAQYIKKVNNNNVCFLMNVYNYSYLDYEQVVYQIDDEMNVIEIDKYYDSQKKLVDVFINNEKIAYLLIDKQNGDSYYQLKKRENNEVVISKNLDFTSEQLQFTNTFSPNIITCNSDLELSFKTFDYLYLPSKIDNTIIYDNLNNNIIECNYKEHHIGIKEEEQTNFSSFGSYKRTYYLNDKLQYLQDITVYVPYFSGVEEGKIYDVGVQLFPNGTASLNGVYIEHGHVINDVGEYELMVKGINETKTIKFTVSNLSCCNTPIEEGKNHLTNFLELEENGKNFDQDTTKITSNLNLNDQPVKKKNFDSTVLFYIMPVLAAGVAITIALRKE